MTHPIEPAGLDRFEVWTSAHPLNEVFDPFRFEHRMAAYREMIDATNRDGQFGADNRRNPMWGLMFQHQWQYRTGRLGARDGRVDPDRLGATATTHCACSRGSVLPKRAWCPRIAKPATPSRFGYRPEDFGSAVGDWRTYFETATADTDNETVRNVVALARTPGWRHRVNLRLRQRVMRTRAARDEVVTMLDALFNPNPRNKAARRRVLGYLLHP